MKKRPGSRSKRPSRKPHAPAASSSPKRPVKFLQEMRPVRWINEDFLKAILQEHNFLKFRLHKEFLGDWSTKMYKQTIWLPAEEFRDMKRIREFTRHLADEGVFGIGVFAEASVDNPIVLPSPSTNPRILPQTTTGSPSTPERGQGVKIE